jgi:hypothetical protein
MNRPVTRETMHDETRTEDSKPGPGLVVRALVGLLVLAFIAQVIGVVRRNINWDEFLFLSTIYRAARGEALPLLQTAYVHLFGWLPHVGSDEIDQVLVGRSIYVLLFAGSLLLPPPRRRWLDLLGRSRPWHCSRSFPTAWRTRRASGSTGCCFRFSSVIRCCCPIQLRGA